MNGHPKMDRTQEDDSKLNAARLCTDNKHGKTSSWVSQLKASNVPHGQEASQQATDQKSPACLHYKFRCQSYDSRHPKLNQVLVSRTCFENCEAQCLSENVKPQTRRCNAVSFQAQSCPNSHGTNVIDSSGDWPKSSGAWRPDGAQMLSNNLNCAGLACNHRGGDELNDFQTRRSSEKRQFDPRHSFQITAPVRFKSLSRPRAEMNLVLHYLRIPTDLRNRISVLEGRLTENRSDFARKCAVINDGNGREAIRESSQHSVSRPGHHVMKLPGLSIATELGYPEHDDDIDDCFADPHGLSQASVRYLKRELCRHLERIRSGALWSVRDMQLVLHKQSRFRDFSEAEVRDHMFYIIRRFVSARNRAVEKFRVYMRNRRWIESTTTREREGFLSRRQNNVLRSWLFANFQNPYPNAEDKRRLVVETRLNPRQINNWLINARSRIWKPTIYHIANNNPTGFIPAENDLDRSRL